MTLNIIELLIVLLGLAITPVLFYRFPRISKAKNDDNISSLSVIIPARNEGKILPRYLRICVSSHPRHLRSYAQTMNRLMILLKLQRFLEQG